MAAHQALPSLGFSRQEHWSGLPFPSPDVKSYVIGKYPDAGKDRRQKEKRVAENEMVR